VSLKGTIALAAGLAGLGCSGPAQTSADAGPADGGDAQVCPSPQPTGDLPCDVSAVFQARCQHCHTIPRLPPPNNAPFNLRTYEDLTSPFGITDLLRWQRVAQVIEPGNYPHMPPAGQPQLTASDFSTLRGWFAACAPPVPEGTGCDVSEGSGSDGGDAASEASPDGAVD
jgi:hypothetical protein